jgi:SAM-dependent methyltransferase
VLDDLRRIAATVDELRGWDFSRVESVRDPVPWDYTDVVRRYLRSSDRVLDEGTGGGEVFLSLAPHFARGVGIDDDPSMIRVAQENTPAALRDRVSFQVMRAEDLGFADESFDIVLNRHANVFADEVARVLRPGGFFIHQTVGREDARNVHRAFGWGPDSFEEGWFQSMSTLADEFRQSGCEVVARSEYDVRLWYRNVESLVFWFKSVPMPEEFDIERHGPKLEAYIAECRTPKGIESNEHRELLIARKL